MILWSQWLFIQVCPVECPGIHSDPMKKIPPPLSNRSNAQSFTII